MNLKKFETESHDIQAEIFASLDKGQPCIVEIDYSNFDKTTLLFVESFPTVEAAEEKLVNKFESIDNPADLNWVLIDSF